MWQVSADHLRALSTDHPMTVTATVFRGKGDVQASNVPVIAGTITATLLADVCREGTIAVPRQLTRQGLFDPAYDKVQIFTGVEGFPPIPLFIGRVVDRAVAGSGMAQIQVEDFGRDIVDARFEQPWQALPRTAAAQEIQRIIWDVDDTFGVDISRALPGRSPSLTWEENRAGALDELAAAINCIWQPNRVGNFEVYPNPYNLTRPPSVSLTISDGPDGIISDLVRHTTRDGVYNSVTVQVERADGTKPVRVTVRDSRPRSPFRWGGAYGKLNRVVRLQTPGGRPEAQMLAQRLLNQSLALHNSMRITFPHFPLLDPGDVIGVTDTEEGDTTVQVVESVQYALEAGVESSAGTRELRKVTEEEYL